MTRTNHATTTSPSSSTTMLVLFFLLLALVAATEPEQSALLTATTVQLDPRVWFKNPSVPRTICTDDEMSYILNAMAQPLNEPLVIARANSVSWVAGFEHTRRGLRGRNEQNESRELIGDCEGICGNGSWLCGWLCSGWRRRHLQVTFDEGLTKEEQNRELDALTTSLKRSLRDICFHTKNAKASDLSSPCAWAIIRADCFSDVHVV